MLRLVCAAAVAGSLGAQTTARLAGFISEADGSDQLYVIAAPKRIEAGTKYPLLLSLHGRGTPPQIEIRRVFGRGPLGDPRLEPARFLGPLPDVEFFVAAPAARGNLGVAGPGEADILQLLAELRRNHPIDPDRVYLTGSDLGAAGALHLAVTRPDLWAAIALLAPEPSPHLDSLLGNLSNTPVRLYQGDRDPVVLASETRALHQKMRDARVPVELIELPGVRHNVWERAYKDLKLFEWLRTHARADFPPRVHLSSAAYKHSRAWWATIDRLTPGTTARLDANLPAPGKIEVTASGLAGFTLQLEGHPAWKSAAAGEIAVNGARILVKGSAISMTLRDGRWAVGRAAPDPAGKRPSAEGPLFEAVSGPHAYIYGTLDHPPPSELERRIAQAREAASWSTRRNPVAVKFRVLADSDAVDSELRGVNLILFGDQRTNGWIARYEFPLELLPGAADYGLLFLAHRDGRYLAINSGLPWWTRADQAARPGLTSVPAPWEVLRCGCDYLLFRGGLDGVIAEGRFDEQWNLPAVAAAAILSSGAFIVKETHDRHAPGRVSPGGPRRNRLDRKPPRRAP